MAWAGSTPTSHETHEDNTAGTTITSDSVTLTTGRLYIIGIAARRGDSVNVVAPTSVLCNGTQAFTIVDATNGLALYDTSSSSRKGFWGGYCIPTGDVTGTIVGTWAASHTNFSLVLVEVASGFDSGAPFLQTTKAEDQSGGSSTTATFGSAMASDSIVVALYCDEGSGTLGPGTGYTELAETNATGSGGVSASAYNGSPDTTFDFTHTNFEFAAAICVEVKASAATTVRPRSLLTLGVGS